MPRTFPQRHQLRSHRSVRRDNRRTNRLPEKPRVKKRMCAVILLAAAVLAGLIVLAVKFTSIVDLVRTTISTQSSTSQATTVISSTSTSLISIATVVSNAAGSSATIPPVISTNTTNVVVTPIVTTNLPTTQDPFACANMTILHSFDLPGADIYQANFTSYNLCCSACLTYIGCVSYTWGLPTAGWAAYACFLKNGTPSAVANSAFVSAHY